MKKETLKPKQVFDKIFAPPCFGEMSENLACNIPLKDCGTKKFGCKLINECTQEAVDRVRYRRKGFKGNVVEEGLAYASAKRRRSGYSTGS